MDSLWLKFKLLSDTTFGRGDGVAGLVDEEAQHDDYGLPYLGGKTLKGLLTSECAEILFALGKSNSAQATRYAEAARYLFGAHGSHDESAALRVGDARPPSDLRAAIVAQFGGLDASARARKRMTMLESLTALRRQTAMDETGAPKEETLRTMRVILRNTPFEAALAFVKSPPDEAHEQDALALLAACVKAFKRAGTGRNRGRGRLQAWLCDADGQDVTATHFQRFCEVINP